MTTIAEKARADEADKLYRSVLDDACVTEQAREQAEAELAKLRLKLAEADGALRTCAECTGESCWHTDGYQCPHKRDHAVAEAAKKWSQQGRGLHGLSAADVALLAALREANR